MRVAMADDVARPRLGRGLAALIGDFGDEAGDANKTQAQRKVAVEFLRPNPAQPASALQRPRTRRARGLDQGARHHPADRGAGARRRAGHLRDRGGRAPLARGPARGTARGAGGHRRDRRPHLARIRHPGERPAHRPQRHRGGRRLRAADERVPATPRPSSPRSSARAAATSPTPCACSSSRRRSRTGSSPARSRPAMPARCSRCEDPEAVARRIVAEGLSVREVEALASAEAQNGEAPRPGRPRIGRGGDGNRSLEQAMARALGVRVSLKAKVRVPARSASATRPRPNSRAVPPFQGLARDLIHRHRRRAASPAIRSRASDAWAWASSGCDRRQASTPSCSSCTGVPQGMPATSVRVGSRRWPCAGNAGRASSPPWRWRFALAGEPRREQGEGVPQGRAEHHRGVHALVPEASIVALDRRRCARRRRRRSGC